MLAWPSLPAPGGQDVPKFQLQPENGRVTESHLISPAVPSAADQLGWG
jgi:hypothetical protein